MGEQFELPQGLAENADIFKEFFSISTWQSLSPSDQAHLQQFLPSFPENDSYEKNVTLKRLFNRENFKFGSPLVTFFNNLQNGHFRPDIAHLRCLMKKAERRQYREQRKRHCFELLKEVIVGRREVLEAAYNSPLGPVKIPKNYYSNNPAVDPVLQRVKKRYFQELSAVRSEVGEYSQSSEDENYQDGAPRTLSKKQKQKLNILESSLMSTGMNMVVSTMSTKPNGFDLESNVTITSNPYEINEEQFRKMLFNHKKRRMNNEKHIELNTSGITLNDVALRTQFGQKRLLAKPNGNGLGNIGYSDKHKKKSSSNNNNGFGQKLKESLDISSSSIKRAKKQEIEVDGDTKSDESTDDEVSSTVMMSESEKNIDIEYSSPTNISQSQKLLGKQNSDHKFQKSFISGSEIGSIEKMEKNDTSNLSLPLEEDNDLKYRRTSELVQDTHVSFFSLLRDIICSSPNHRMTLDKIEHHLKSWELNPISPLNDWFTLVDEPWTSLLESALSFLSADYPDLQPDDFVPYIEYKSQIQSYQWIGAGRDSDSHLLNLCSHWLDRKDDVYHSNLLGENSRNQEEVVGECLEEVEEPKGEVPNDFVPPPRCPTNWTVRLSTEEERRIFQIQELERFENPHKAFTYRMHGYESVVGPVKGIYITQTSSSVLKPRGHNLLAVNRPSYVTILALVRDAAARLPNGEGTRADICTLIRDSQYLDLSEAAENTLQSVVSGALDRLHYEVDACVKFDTKRKLWIYLHRRRSEAEMEKIHQQYQGVAKTLKKPPRKRTIKKPDSVESKDKDSLIKEGGDKRKAKTKQNMVVQPMLKNVDTQVFQNVTADTKFVDKQQKETLSETQVEDFMVMESQVLEDLMSLSCETFKTSGEPDHSAVKQEKTDIELESSETKIKTISNKMPGQSLLNQDFINKSTLVQGNNLRVLKAKQTKPGVLNLVSTGDKLQQSDGQAVIGHILKSDNRPQEIVTTAGKKIIIQTSFAGGRTPVKFVTANTNQLGRKIITTKQTSPQIQRITPSLSKVTNTSQQQIRTVGNQQQDGALHGVVKTTPATQFVQNSGIVTAHVKGLSTGTQFLTATGQKVQIIAGSQNLGQIQSIHLGGGQNILAQNVHSTSSNINAQTANLIGNIQQVQLLTSAGQIITKALPISNATEEKTSEAVKISSPTLKVGSSTVPNISTVRNAITGQQLQMTITKPTGGKTIKNVKMVTCQPSVSDSAKSMSLLTTSQQKNTNEKKEVKEQKIIVQKTSAGMAGKIGTQLLNVSSVQLLNPRTNQGQIQTITKPIITKNNAPILTGVKLVNTQQGVKMVATSSTVVQNAIQPAKPVTHISKLTSNTNQNSASTNKGQNRPAQIISMESTASLIQIPSSTDGVPQFAVVSQGNVISVAGQPRVIQTQQITNASQSQTHLATSTATINQGKAIINKNTTTPAGTGVRVSGAVNLATIAGKPMILTSGSKTQGQHPNVILTSQNPGNNQAIVLTQGNVRTQNNSGTVTLVQQGTTQQILLPAGFQGGTINLKSLPGVKVIPFTGTTQKGRQQVYARIVKTSNQNSPQPGTDNSVDEQ
ncbi:nfrkb, putative [Pediculus humanus corporis]|uniref:Nfrkb, putative n=1 Tax=Pediculus humanus subsp. corporis TaxID=121224 RepID=E0VM25_PEDHC|nr:nfrkb, putative [Pediculus humanus corporis]EEB14431.1 nfrkb, putative [Pediculus humanus corporis]